MAGVTEGGELRRGPRFRGWPGTKEVVVVGFRAGRTRARVELELPQQKLSLDQHPVTWYGPVAS